jgi:hypothetical protein
MTTPLEHMFRLGRPKFLMYSNIIYTVGVAAAYKSNPTLPFNLGSYIWICLMVRWLIILTNITISKLTVPTRTQAPGLEVREYWWKENWNQKWRYWLED